MCDMKVTRGIAASVIHAIGYGFNQAAKKAPADREFDLELCLLIVPLTQTALGSSRFFYR